MIVSIHQPDYIPYIGFFYKISQSDIFVFLDDAQFSNNNMHHWNRIKTPQGEHRLKIPLNYHFGDAINQVRTRDDLKWKERHLKTVEMNYKKASFFKNLYPKYAEVFLKEYCNLAEMNIAINTFICHGFGISPMFVRSSDLNISTQREERVIDICKALDGTIYISGNGAKAYQVYEHFTMRGVELIYTNYKPVEYSQLWKEFIPNLSIIDYIFNRGFDWEYIRKTLNDRQVDLLIG